MVGVIFVYVGTVFGFMGILFLRLVGCFSMIVWTPAALCVLYACFCLFVCLFLFVCFLYLHLFSAIEHVSHGKAL